MERASLTGRAPDARRTGSHERADGPARNCSVARRTGSNPCRSNHSSRCERNPKSRGAPALPALGWFRLCGRAGTLRAALGSGARRRPPHGQTASQVLPRFRPGIRPGIRPGFVVGFSRLSPGLKAENAVKRKPPARRLFLGGRGGAAVVQRWCGGGLLTQYRTAGGHRRYALSELRGLEGRDATPGLICAPLASCLRRPGQAPGASWRPPRACSLEAQPAGDHQRTQIGSRRGHAAHQGTHAPCGAWGAARTG